MHFSHPVQKLPGRKCMLYWTKLIHPTSSKLRSKGSHAAIPNTVNVVELTVKRRVVMMSSMQNRCRLRQSMMRPVGLDLKRRQVEMYIG